MGIERWREIGTRLRRMDRAELRDRTRQEFAKRQDALLAKLGFDFASDSRNTAHAHTGNFFFTSESVESILALLRQRVPGQAEQIVQQADKICSHRFDLLGYKDLDYGSPIDWHLDAVHDKRSPKKAFYRVSYLDFAEVGDSKVTWELNRHQHFVTLAKAFRLTGESRFVQEILQQWRHWKSENPYPTGINWASSLEVAFRSLSWIWTCQLLEGTLEASELRGEWLPGLAFHGRHIERYLSTYFSPNTHLLGEGVALFFLGVMCPELRAAERWKSLGWKIILQEAERQVRPDGFHFEQSTYYHVYAIDFFLHSAILANLNNVSTPQGFERTLEKMLDALMLLGRTGHPPGVGDDDGGRLFDPRRNRGEHLIDPLSTGAVLFQRSDFKAAAGELREETLWLLGADGIRQWDEMEAALPSREPVALRDAGIYLLTGKSAATQLVLHAGPQETQSTGHRHSDALSLCLQSHGDSLLIDPETFEYVGPGADRDLFRGTAMHNTVRVDERDQAEVAGPFSWRRMAQSKVEQWIQGGSFDLLVASHDGYQRLAEPVTHRRYVVSLRNGAYLIRDVVEGTGKHRLEIPWHFGQDLQLVEHGLYRVRGASHGLALLSPETHGWAEEVRKESWSPVYGQKAPMTVLRFCADAALPAEFAVLLVTLEEAHQPPGVFTRIDSADSNSSVCAYRYVGESEESSYIFAMPGKSWQAGKLSSDAEFVCWTRASPDSEQHLILCNGTFATVHGGLEIRCRDSVTWAEVVVKGGKRIVHSSSPASIEENVVVAQQGDGTSPVPE
jgi:Heparinase II/III-like protein/Heparinase II/III N-terminus